MIKLSIKQLSAIRELAATKNFTIAAANLHTSQSNLSMTIREAEEIVGVRLFDRTTKVVSTTAAGEAFAQSVARLLDDLGAQISDLQSIGSLSSGTLALGVTPLLGSTVVAKVIAEFSARFPRILIRMEDASTDTLVALLTSRKIELAIGTFDGRASEIQAVPLFEDPLVALSHPSLALGESVTWAQLADLPLIGIENTSSVGRLIEHAFWSSGRRHVHPTITSHHWMTVISLTKSSKGVCIVPKYACTATNQRGLNSSLVIDPVVSRAIGLASIKGRSLSPAAEELAALIKATLKKGPINQSS